MITSMATFGGSTCILYSGSGIWFYRGGAVSSMPQPSVLAGLRTSLGRDWNSLNAYYFYQRKATEYCHELNLVLEVANGFREGHRRCDKQR